MLVVLAAASPAEGAWEGDYGSRTAITFGAPDRVRVPVEAALPVPAAGGPVTRFAVAWNEPVPQSDGGLTYRKQVAFDTAGCTATDTCRVEAVLPTARMANGTVSLTFTVSNADGLVSFFTRQHVVDNPKPTVAFTTPMAGSALWGDVTIAAEAAPSPDAAAAPLAGVRFYLTGTLSEDSPYVFDATAPYAVTVPATDIAPVLSSRHLVAVAEDGDGNLSVMPTGGSAAVRRLVTVGPPPEVRIAPAWAGGANGSVESGVDVTFHAELPETAPARPGSPVDPYVASVSLVLDGRTLWTAPHTQPTPWNGYQAGQRSRAVTGTVSIGAASGLTAGRHLVGVRVTTSYGGVSTATVSVLVADGVNWGPMVSAGRRVPDGHVVTAGTRHTFVVPVTARVPGTGLLFAGWRDDDSTLEALCFDDAPCPDSAVLELRDWRAPSAPGTVMLSASVKVQHEATARTLTRMLVVQPAARLTAAVSRRRAAPGRVVRLTGRLTRRDTGESQIGQPVAVEHRPVGADRWRLLATARTGESGEVSVVLRPRRSGAYRLRSAERRGTIGAATSPARSVVVRR